MTSPVTTAASPAARPAASADAGGADSAEPFATALDGALTAGRPAADDAGLDGGQGGSGEEEPAGEGVPATVADTVPAAPDGLLAALWARLTGSVAPAGTGPDGKPVDAAAPGRPAVTGLAHARDVASDVAHGLRDTQPGKVAGIPAPAGAVPPAPTGAAPGPVPSTPPAAAALAAAGVEIVLAPASDAPAATGSPAAAAAEAPAPGSGSSSAPASVAVPPTAGAPARGDTGPDGRPDGGPSDGAPDQASGVAGPTGAPAPTATAPAPRADAPASPSSTAQHVAGQLARPVAVLRGGPDGTHTMTVVLTPETLGPVEISVTVSQGNVELTLRGAHDHGRAALIDALPELRRDLEAAGLTCSRVDVDRGNRDGASSSSAQQQAAGRDSNGGRQHERGDGARPWHRPADNGEGRPARTRTASGLDVRV